MSPADPHTTGGGRTQGETGRLAPLKVALAVAGAATAAIVVSVAVVMVLAWHASRVPPEFGPLPGGPPHTPWQERVIDLGDLVLLLLLLAAGAVIFVAAIAWWSTKLANRPLERALQIQKAFVADASHELRTPLTTLNSRIQLAQHRLAEGGDVAGALTDLRKDADAMNFVLTDLLVAAELTAVTEDVRVSDAGAACAEAMRLSAPAAQQKGVGLTQALQPGLIVMADQTPVTRALVALLDNAIRHTPQGGQVVLKGSQEAGSGFVDFRVADTGPGLAAGDPEALFTRFARGGDASTQNFGLGLALVRDVARRFSGSVEVEATGPEGTTFLLRLPAARS